MGTKNVSEVFVLSAELHMHIILIDALGINYCSSAYDHVLHTYVVPKRKSARIAFLITKYRSKVTLKEPSDCKLKSKHQTLCVSFSRLK